MTARKSVRVNESKRSMQHINSPTNSSPGWSVRAVDARAKGQSVRLGKMNYQRRRSRKNRQKISAAKNDLFNFFTLIQTAKDN